MDGGTLPGTPSLVHLPGYTLILTRCTMLMHAATGVHAGTEMGHPAMDPVFGPTALRLGPLLVVRPLWHQGIAPWDGQYGHPDTQPGVTLTSVSDETSHETSRV